VNVPIGDCVGASVDVVRVSVKTGLSVSVSTGSVSSVPAEASQAVNNKIMKINKRRFRMISIIFPYTLENIF
jgi:hypothetical protein